MLRSRVLEASREHSFSHRAVIVAGIIETVMPASSSALDSLRPPSNKRLNSSRMADRRLRTDEHLHILKH